MKNFIKLIVTLFSINNVSWADCTVQCPVTDQNVGKYFDADHFSWSNYDDDVHMLIGFGGALTIGEALTHYAKMPSWEAALIGGVAMGMVGTTKEVMFDTYTGRTDIKTWWIGGAAGGVTVMALHF